jgi:hypothetical protein
LTEHCLDGKEFEAVVNGNLPPAEVLLEVDEIMEGFKNADSTTRQDAV